MSIVNNAEVYGLNESMIASGYKKNKILVDRGIVKNWWQVKTEWYEEGGKYYKQCSMCKEFKEVCTDNFRKSKGLFGCHSICRLCSNESSKRYKENNLEKVLAKDKEWYQAHKKEKSVYSKQWKKENAEYLTKYRSEYRKKYYQRDKHKCQCHWKIHHFLENNKLKPYKCMICNTEGKKIIFHHPDYSYWNKGIFICEICHKNIHCGNITEYESINLLDNKDLEGLMLETLKYTD